MPLYEYECDAQQHRFEVIQKFSDAPIAVCPTCGSTVHKLMSAPAFQLKGTGWYITDYAKKDGAVAAGKSANASEKDSSTPAEKSGGDKTESTPKADAAPAASTSSDKSSSEKSSKD